jgi:hypothetical protein
MSIYTVTILGKSFMLEADNNYQARRLAAEEYRKIDSTSKPAVLRALCSVRVSEESDKRVKYPIKTSEDK